MGSRNKYIISEVLKNENHESPIILNFQNDKLNLENNAVAYTTAYDTEQKEQVAILATNGSNIYRGSVNANFPDHLVDTYIALSNKDTKTVRFIQVNQALLKHKIHSQQCANVQNKFDKKTAFKQLIKNFGGRKSGKYLERFERMKVNVDGIKEQLESTVENFDISNGASVDSGEIIDSALDDILPPFNKNALHVNDIYKLNEIISQQLLDRLNEDANEVLATSENLPIPSEYILKQIEAIKLSPSKNSPNNLMKIKVFLYMDALITLIKTRNRDLGKTTLSNITEKVENDIRLNFSPKGSTKLIKTTFSTDKALCYLIVLGILMSPNYEIDIEVFIKEVCKSRPKILQYAGLVNAKLKPRTNILTFCLPGTLQPKILSSRKRKRV